MARKTNKERERYHEERRADRLDVNAVVSYRLKKIRERRGWTQEFVAERLAQFTGKKLPQASISAMERGFDGERRRRFDAHELYLLSQVFDVPMVYFFIPPAEVRSIEIADSERPVAELYASLVGREHQLDIVDEALEELGIDNPETLPDVVAAIFGPDGPSSGWQPQHFRRWRAERIRQITDQFTDRIDAVTDVLDDLVTNLKGVGLKNYFAANVYKDTDDRDVMEALTQRPTPDEDE